MLGCTQDAGGVSFAVRIVPRASWSEIIGEHGGALRVRLAAPPVEGAANEELIRLLARAVGVPRGGVKIVGGHTGRGKRVRVEGVGCGALERLIECVEK